MSNIIFTADLTKTLEDLAEADEIRRSMEELSKMAVEGEKSISICPQCGDPGCYLFLSGLIK